MRTRKRALDPSEFWSWFLKTADSIASNPQDPAVLSELDGRLRRLDSRLSWEIGPGLSKRWQLVISPNLKRSLRKIAKTVVSAAPVLPDWEFHSARQPKNWQYKFELENPKGNSSTELDASAWTFVLLKYPEGTNEILLKAENVIALTNQQRKLAATIVLESILGEDTLLDSVYDFQLVEELEPRFRKRQRPIRLLRDAVRGVSSVH